jgi:hypothetical protein
MLMSTVVADGSVRVAGTVILAIRALILVSVIAGEGPSVRGGYFDGLVVHGAIVHLTDNLLSVEAAACEPCGERRAESPSGPHAPDSS